MSDSKATWPEEIWIRAPGRRWTVWLRIAAYVVIALAVALPLLRQGYLFGFDMAFGPREHIPPEAFGLGSDFGRRLPTFLAIALSGPIGASEYFGKVVIFSIPLLAGLGMHRLAPTRSEAARYVAGILYAINPFVYERLVAGHWHLLLGYALLPWALPTILSWARFGNRIPDSDRGHNLTVRLALWLGMIGIASFVVSTEAFLIALAAVLLLRNGQFARRLVASGALAGIFLVTNATWIVAALVKAGDITSFSRLDFRAFLVRGNSPIAATANVARLTGFFREDFRSPVLATPAGLILFVVILGLVGLGLVVAVRTGRMGPRVAWLLVAIAVGSAVVALGERTPLIGPALGWLYPRIPGMQIFRESQKLVGLIALVYAIFIAPGAEAVMAPTDRPVGRLSRLGAIATAAVLIAIPIAWTPNVFWGAGGRIQVSKYPDGWAEAESQMSGPGRALVFPWHVDLPLSFAGGRTTVDPAGDYFSKDLVQAGQIEFPGFRLGVEDPVDAYVRGLIAAGSEITDVGAATAPLGVDSIVLLKEADWREYGFLDHQDDLTKVVDNDSVAVYQTPGPAGALERLAPPGEVTATLFPDPRNVGYLDSRSPPAGECPIGSGIPVRDPIFVYRINAPGCWLIPESRAWRSPSGPADRGVATAVRSDGPERLVYWPAIVAIGGHLVSTLAIVGSALFLLIARIRIRRSRRSEKERA